MRQSNTDWSEVAFWAMLGLVIISVVVGATMKEVLNPNTPCPTVEVLR